MIKNLAMKINKRSSEMEVIELILVNLLISIQAQEPILIALKTEVSLKLLNLIHKGLNVILSTVHF